MLARGRRTVAFSPRDASDGRLSLPRAFSAWCSNSSAIMTSILAGRPRQLYAQPITGSGDSRIDGASCVDRHNGLKRGTDEVKRARDYAVAVRLSGNRTVLDEKLAVRSANRSFYEFFRNSPQQIEGAACTTIDRQLDLPAARIVGPPAHGRSAARCRDRARVPALRSAHTTRERAATYGRRLDPDCI